MAPEPTAATISVQQALQLLDGPFDPLAMGIAQGQYALWLGSGISCERVEDLKNVVARVLDFLQVRCDVGNPGCPYRRALDEALGYAQLSVGDRATIDYARPLAEWPPIDTVLRNLTREYARLLDIRIQGYPDEDYLLWEAVDVPATFAAATAEPDCEHLCLAILILEGVLPNLPSANWDGLIEAAVDDLTNSSGMALRVCVRAEDLREPPLLTRLLKFHGCAVRAGLNPALYRRMLIARQSQIDAWGNNPEYALMKQELVTMAATRRTLMIGLSGQDTNIRQLFIEGQTLMHWVWPCSPPAHVFAEDCLGSDQRTILQMVYRDAYGANQTAIESGALLRAYAKPALTALVLHILCTKLRTLARVIEAPCLSAADHTAVEDGILHLRRRIAAHGDSDRLRFIRTLIAGTAKAISLFKTGVGAGSGVYQSIGSTPVHMMTTDANLATSGLRELASTLGLIGIGDRDGHWTVDASDPGQPNAGAVTIQAVSGPTRVFFAANDRAGVQMEINGCVTPDDADAIIIHSTSPVLASVRSPRAAPGRTGHVGLRHVAMGELLRGAASAGELLTRFREEASL